MHRNEGNLELLSTDFTCGIKRDEKFINIENVKQRDIKHILLRKKYDSLKESDFKFKIKANTYYGDIDDEEWTKIFMLPRMLPVENRLKELQYRIIMRYVPTNYLLHKMNISNSQTCVFCRLYPETIDHIFFNCTEVKSVWLDIVSRFQDSTGLNISPTLRQFMLGMYSVRDPATTSLNIVILLMKSYILTSKYESSELNPVVFSSIARSKILLYQGKLSPDTYDILSRVFDTNN